MSFLSQAKTKRLLTVHGWSGTILGILLFACIFTGSIVVFEDEIQDWSSGGVGQYSGLGTRVHHEFTQIARDVDPRYYEEVSLFRLPSGGMRYLFHTHETDPDTGQIVEYGVRVISDPKTGGVAERWEGPLRELPSDNRSALRDFWVDLHVQLYLPNPYGLVLVGVLGMMMMAAAISGILIHRHVVRDAFVAARETKRLVGARDLHVLAGTWGLPFAFILAFTGAFFGFATTIGVPVVALAAFDGDQAALVESVLGIEEDVDLTPAPLASLDYIIMQASEISGTTAHFVRIMNYGAAGAEVLVTVGASNGSLSGGILAFDGVSRAFEGERPVLGTVPSLGSSLFSIMAPLHFGNFAGFASKLVWMGMGLAMAYVTATGMLLWTKRREEIPRWRAFRHWIIVTIWGLPIAMLVSAVAFFLSVPAGDPHWWTPFGFLVGTLGVIVQGLRRRDPQPQFRLVAAGLCLIMPVIRHITGGTSWSEALLQGGTEILVVDFLLLVLGLLLLRKARPSEINAKTETVLEPAE